MNIQDFSERTGISKSALRYYESIGLLNPKNRGENGYRRYTVDQIETVKLISSLRLAEVPIKEIQIYLLENDETRRKLMMQNWIENINKKRDILAVSLRYLESESTNKEIYLVEKPSEKIIWYEVESRIGEFKKHFIDKGEELKKLNILFKNCYLKYVSGQSVIQGRIGFGIGLDQKINGLSDDAVIEQLPQCISIAMPFKGSITTIQSGYKKILNYAIENNLTPIYSVMEWYHGVDFTQLDLIMPVIQIDRRGV